MAATAASVRDVNDSTRMANTETVLTPRFYTTDFDAMNAMDLSSVRGEWDALMDEFENDTNKNHFKRDEQFREELKDLPPALYDEFIGFLVSSATSEYSELPAPREEVHVLQAEVHPVRDLPVGENRLRPLHPDLPPARGPPGAALPPDLPLVRALV